MSPPAETLEDLLDELGRTGEGDSVSVGEVVDRFRERSVGVLLALVGLIVVVPLVGDIPGVPSVCATLVLTALVRSLRGSGGPWLPAFVRRRATSRDRLGRAVEAARPWIRRVDRLIRPRLGALVDGRVQRLAIAAAGGALALSLYPMEFVPFGANAPGAGLVALGIGRMTGDGVLVLLGYGLSALTVYLLVTAISAGPW